MDQVCYNPEFTMEMLEQWVAATGPFASFPWGTPLQKTLGSLERYHYDSKQHLTWSPSVYQLPEGSRWRLVCGGLPHLR